MPKVAAIAVPGLDLWFNSGDHLPPHFHAERTGEWQVRVYFRREPAEMIDVVYGKPTQRELRDLRRETEHARAELLAEWEAKVIITEPGAER